MKIYEQRSKIFFEIILMINCSEFYGLLQTGMFERLFEATDSKMTVFVPNNDAFNDIVDADLDDLRTNRKMLAKVLCKI